MTHAPDTQPPDRSIRAEYPCRVCNARAGQAELKIYTGYDEATLVVSGIVGRITTWVATDNIARVENFIERGEACELYAWEYDSASFYCPACDKVYCQAHWQIEVVFEDDPDWRGWYDCTYGTCPHGHRRVIDD